jgi:rare lipoprotein A
MLSIVVRIAAVITVLVSSAKAEEGIASEYGRNSGTVVACGGTLNESALTAAHRSLPCGSRVRVTNKNTGKSVVVTINDRGPFMRGRVIDLTPAAARNLGMRGLAQVSVARE